jgi:hypothetical protein
LSTKNVRLELADLPFPRLSAITDLTAMRDRSFSRLVAELQHDLDALVEPRIHIDFRSRVLMCGGRRVRLPRVRLAIYELLAERRLDGCASPACSGCADCYLPAGEITASFAAALAERVHTDSSPSWGVDASWDAKSFREHVSKINRAIDATLRGASRVYRIEQTGPRGSRRYGIPIQRNGISIDRR